MKGAARASARLKDVAALAEVIVDAVGCIGVCVETWMGFEERRRIDMQREVVRHFLDGIGILPFDQALTPARPTLA